MAEQLNKRSVTLLEKVMGCEHIFTGYTLAFDVACVLAEANDDETFITVEEIVSYLDEPSSYDCENEKELTGFVREIVKTYGERLTEHGFVIEKREKGYRLNKRRRKRKPMKPRDKLVAHVSAKTKRKLNYVIVTKDLTRQKGLSYGDVIQQILDANFPKTPEGIIEQVQMLLEEVDIPASSDKETISTGKPPEISRLIYKIANELGISLGMVVELIASYLPKPSE